MEIPTIFCEAKNSLAEIILKKYRLEITLNHPRTVPFVRASPEKQKSIYYNIYSVALQYLKKHLYVMEDVYRYEVCKDGNIHMHAYIDIEGSKVFSIEGLVMETVRKLVFEFPKRTHSQLANNYYSTVYQVFKSPAVLVQFTNLSDEKRAQDWCAYINKNNM